ncbi:MAG: hypothetical protein ACI80L_000898, partial [Pseudohongiellaceae bacterium]
AWIAKLLPMPRLEPETRTTLSLIETPGMKIS